MYGFVSGISDMDDINYCPKCGEKIYSYKGNSEASEDVPLLDIGGEYEFTAEIQPPERMTVRDMILVLFGLDVEKLKQNNW